MSELLSTMEDPVVKEEPPDEVKCEPDSWDILKAEPSEEATVKDEVDLEPIKLMPVDMQYVMRSCKKEETSGETERGDDSDQELQDSESSEEIEDSEGIDEIPDSDSHTAPALRVQLESGTGRKQQPDPPGSDLSTSQELVSHLTSRKKTGSFYSCSICNIKFKSKLSLRKHLQTHKDMKCEVCQKSFDCYNDFKRHRKSHLEKKVVHCKICNRDFAHNQIKFHMQVSHATTKPYRCDFCQKTFAIESLLIRHKLCHNKYFQEVTDPYIPVKRGSRTYKSAHAAAQEVSKVELPQKCNICKKTFALKANYYSHINTHITEPTSSP